MGKPKIKLFIIMLIMFLGALSITGCSRQGKDPDVRQKRFLKDSVSEANTYGLQLVDEGKAEEALTYFEKALDYAQQYKELANNTESVISEDLIDTSYNNICLAYNLMEEYDLGLEYGNLAIQILPNTSYEHSNRGNAYLGLDKYEEALSDYEKALELSPMNSYAHYGIGTVRYVRGEYKEAIESFNNSIKHNKDDIDAYEYIIWCYYYLGDYDKGIELSEKVIDKDSDFKIHYVKGMIILAKEGNEEAERYFQEIAMHRDEIEAKKLLGEFYYKIEDYTNALEVFMKCKDQLKPNSDLDCWIILCYTSQRDMEKADLYYQEVVKEGTATTKVCNYIGNEFAYEQYYMESLKYYEDAIRIDQKHKQSYINMIRALYNGKRYSRCIEFGKTALEVFGEDFDVAVYIGESYFNLSDYESALVWYERALEVDPDSDVVLSYKSDAYLLLEDYENAKKYANEALSKNQSNSIAQGVKTSIAKKQQPIEQQLKDFIQLNYLYNVNEQDINQILQKKPSTNEEISSFLEKVKRPDDPFTFCIYDDYFNYFYDIFMKDVDFKEYDYMKYIRIHDFNLGTDDQVIEILDSIENPQNCILTIDLRMNGGGHTIAANNILDALLPSCVTCTLIYKDGYTYNYYSDASSIKFKEIYILIDDQSASASELLTLGLKTYLDNVTVIGSNSYGKGVGQTVFEDKKRSLMVNLVNHFWNVREQNINNIGIIPDIQIKSKDLSDYLEIIKNNV